jgi:hypothetical protein
VLRARFVSLIAVWGFGAQPLGAQEAVATLPVSGSLIYNALFLNRVYGTDTRGFAMRFAGRVGTQVARGTYIGLGGGSWVRVIRAECAGFPDCDRYVGSQSEAIVYQLYLQRYVRRNQLFLRGGLGLANTTTLLPENGLIAVTRRWRAALSVGTGVDLRITRFLYLTPSLDVTLLPGTDTRREELRSGITPGVGLTLR